MTDEAEKPVEPAAESPAGPADATGNVGVEASAADPAPAAPAVPEANAADPAPAAPAVPEASAADPAPAAPAVPEASGDAADAAPKAESGRAAGKLAAPRPTSKEPPEIKKTRARPAAPVRAKPARKAPVQVRIATPGTPARKVRAPKPVSAPAIASNASKPLPDNDRAARKNARPQTKEKSVMAKTVPTDFLASFQTAFTDLQGKAKATYEKSTAALGEANEFAKGNVEALVESGKILTSGVQDLGTELVSESRAAFETISADVKELASVKSPAEFLSLQSALARKSFDTAIAHMSKNTEAMIKLANEVITPISSRVTLAVEKVGKAA